MNRAVFEPNARALYGAADVFHLSYSVAVISCTKRTLLVKYFILLKQILRVFLVKPNVRRMILSTVLSITLSLKT